MYAMIAVYSKKLHSSRVCAACFVCSEKYLFSHFSLWQHDSVFWDISLNDAFTSLPWGFPGFLNALSGSRRKRRGRMMTVPGPRQRLWDVTLSVALTVNGDYSLLLSTWLHIILIYCMFTRKCGEVYNVQVPWCPCSFLVECCDSTERSNKFTNYPGIYLQITLHASGTGMGSKPFYLSKPHHPGVSVPPEDAQKAFDPYHHSKNKQPGIDFVYLYSFIQTGTLEMVRVLCAFFAWLRSQSEAFRCLFEHGIEGTERTGRKPTPTNACGCISTRTS